MAAIAVSPKDPENMTALLDKASQMDPKNPALLTALAECQLKSNNPTAAAATYEQASPRGLIVRKSDGSLMRYRDAVRNHFVASISTKPRCSRAISA